MMLRGVFATAALAGSLVLSPGARAQSASVAKDPFEVAVEGALPEAVAEYEWFHAHPELSNAETETAAHLGKALRDLGLEVHEGIGGTGIVGILRNGDGPTVLYRADMDGLPVTEATGVRYASQNPGVMHACGHDVHMATAIGALRSMVETKAKWRGTIFFVGQPAEELGSGARLMLADKRFRSLLKKEGTPKLAVAIHDAADVPAGSISVVPGFHNANVDSVDIVIHGKGGHGAKPHKAIDPIVIGAEVVMSLQTIVSRRLGPDEEAVITVGRFDAGTKHNIIPPTATLLLTVRSYSDETRKTVLAEIERVTRQIAKAHRAPRAPDVKVAPSFVPACYNDPPWTERLRKAWARDLGADAVLEHTPSMGGEDFGLFAKELKIPAVMWRVGGVDPKRWKRTGGKGLPGLHSDGWAPLPEPTVRTGITSVVTSLREALAPAP